MFCNNCKTDKPTDMFSKNRLGFTGYQAYCKECMKKRYAKKIYSFADTLIKNYGKRLSEKEKDQINRNEEWKAKNLIEFKTVI